VFSGLMEEKEQELKFIKAENQRLNFIIVNSIKKKNFQDFQYQESQFA